MIRQTWKMAISAVLANKLRTFLTMLGVIIGVAALIILVSIADGASTSVSDRISSMGSNYLLVRVTDDKENPIRLLELSELFEEETIEEYAPYGRTSATGKSGYTEGSMTVYGTTASYFSILDQELAAGRFLKKTDVDNHTYVIVISAETAVENIMTARLNNDEDAYSIQNQSEVMEAMEEVNATMKLMLGGIAGISLLVGGIGIMNIMLVSVTERTKEIGIRKAIGATRQSILLQFLLEAVIVSLSGCLVGVVFSWVAIQVIGVVMSNSIPLSMNWSVVGIAIAFSCVIGVLFGLYPAAKAAGKKPIDALRYEG